MGYSLRFRAAAIVLLGSMAVSSWSAVPRAAAEPASGKSAAVKPWDARKRLLEQVSAASGVPWTSLAAVDQYERTINTARKRKASAPLAGVYYTEEEWFGALNPDHSDPSARTIALFGGAGTDGSGDGLADPANDLDVLSSRVRQLTRFGTGADNWKIGVAGVYGSERAVERIAQFEKIYNHFQKLDLNDHAFPVPLKANYSYRGTWGASRGWGGHRMHEGTDIFAGYGVPARSTCYGIVEVMGWNNYGGWRIGIRDVNNLYHYFAHLSGFAKPLKPGDLVKPGQVIGWVGSSGYGKPGTSGKFPPHLHYGIYRDNGTKEWSFDPYPMLRQWEKQERTKGLKVDAVKP
ncbi:M23 family metallopeptidase [Paenibacillus aurantius]|uniref:M23 family metallopeptidase n=1 Tax=Paenibacillus aurantius TaxID=2918900 RepID=A0AA96LIH0_9BACL|nr:M23 family metallopeptidase [Paenibacillus aurantius]WNQ12571.1 M23 family metallopeptidase [Paenibacillus aurantius]